MRLLVCTTHRRVRGGVETYLRALLPALRDRHEVALLYEDEREGAARIDGGVAPDALLALGRAPPEAVFQAISRFGPDVVLSHGLADRAFEGRLAEAFPSVYFAHNYAGTCLSGLKRFAAPRPEPCARRLGPGCLVRYFPRRCGGLDPLVMWKDYRGQRRILAVLERFGFLVVASGAMRAEYLRHGFRPGRVRLAPLFPAQFSPDPEPPRPGAWSGAILLAGRLTQVKGGEVLLDALRRIASLRLLDRPLRLVFAGEGPEARHWAERARRLDVPATFAGWLEPEPLRALMREACLLALPSLWPEPFGLLGLEAGCVGLPSVAFAHGGITDWLVEGETGALAPSPPSAEGLAQAIVRALGDPERHGRLRLGAWRTARRFSLERHLDALEATLRDAVETTKQPLRFASRHA